MFHLRNVERIKVNVVALLGARNKDTREELS